MTASRINAMLIALSAATFVVTSSGSGTAPFLSLMSADLETALPKLAHLFSVQAITWGATSLLAGVFSDRFGRRGIMVASVVLLGATRLGLASSQTYTHAIVWQIISGVGGGAFMGTVYAVVSDHVPAGKRGRAMSWVITGQSLSLVLGVPIVTLLGTFGGWRGAMSMLGAAAIVAAVAARLATPPDPPQHAATRVATPYGALLRPRLIALLSAGTTERLCFATLAIYLPIYLQQSYAVSLGTLALVLALVAAGNLVGNIVGGRIADRTRSRSRVFALASAATAVLALPTLLWQPGLVASVALGFAYSFVNATGRPSLMATLAEMPSELRGALFGLNIAMASIGWLLAGSMGGWLIASTGFDGLGVFCAVAAALGTVFALISSPAKAKTQAA